MKSEKIIIAVPRGRITRECKDLLNKTNFIPDPKLFDDSSRKLTFSSLNENIDYSDNIEIPSSSGFGDNHT
mgnify:CR=1 FL=1